MGLVLPAGNTGRFWAGNRSCPSVCAAWKIKVFSLGVNILQEGFGGKKSLKMHFQSKLDPPCLGPGCSSARCVSEGFGSGQQDPWTL